MQLLGVVDLVELLFHRVPLELKSHDLELLLLVEVHGAHRGGIVVQKQKFNGVESREGVEDSQLLETQICLPRRVNGGFRLARGSRYRSLLRNIRLSCPPIIDRLPNFIQLICDIRRKQFLILHLLNILIHLLQLHLIQSIVALSSLDPIKRVGQINIHLLFLQTLVFGFRPI